MAEIKDLKPEEKQMIESAKANKFPSHHSQLYFETEHNDRWVLGTKGEDLCEKKYVYKEWDILMTKWVVVKTETLLETPEQNELFKEVKFLLCFPAENEGDTVVRGKVIKKLPKFIAQAGTLKIRDEFKHFYITKSKMKGTSYGGQPQNCLFVKELPQGCCFKRLLNGENDQVSVCILEAETEVSLQDLGKLEREGGYMIYYPKVTYDEIEGSYQYWNNAGAKHITGK
jgi:hypothetical protein